jgi:hypothetical protein
MRSFLPQVLHTVWCSSKLYAHKNNCKNNLREKEKKKGGGGKGKENEEKKTAHVGTNVRTRVLNVGLLARSQFASGRSCDRPNRSRFSVVFLGPRANAELVPKFQVAQHASHATLLMVTQKISPTLT